MRLDVRVRPDALGLDETLGLLRGAALDFEREDREEPALREALEREEPVLREALEREGAERADEPLDRADEPLDFELLPVSVLSFWAGSS